MRQGSSGLARHGVPMPAQRSPGFFPEFDKPLRVFRRATKTVVSQNAAEQTMIPQRLGPSPCRGDASPGQLHAMTPQGRPHRHSHTSSTQSGHSPEHVGSAATCGSSHTGSIVSSSGHDNDRIVYQPEIDGGSARQVSVVSRSALPQARSDPSTTRTWQAWESPLVSETALALSRPRRETARASLAEPKLNSKVNTAWLEPKYLPA